MSKLFTKGQRLVWRRLNGRLVDVTVLKPGRFRSLVHFYINEYWERPGDMGPPREVAKTKWNFRMFDDL